MSKERDDLLYDDDESVKFIKNALPESVRNKYDDDDIIYIVDLIYEFYDSKGFMDDDQDDEVEIDIDEDELVAFILSNAIEDGIGKYETEDISLIVDAELDYCESIGFFD